MVDSASCAVSVLTEGLWSALLLLNPLKQSYTKPKSSFILHPKERCRISRNSSGETVTVPPLRHLYFPVSWHMPGSGCTTGPAFDVAEMPVFCYLGHYPVPRCQNAPGTWICTGSVTWLSLPTQRYPLSCSWGGVSHGSFPAVSYWRLSEWYPVSLIHPTSCWHSRRDSLPSLGNHSQPCVSHCFASAFPAFAFRTEGNHWISLANSWCSSSFCPSFF